MSVRRMPGSQVLSPVAGMSSVIGIILIITRNGINPYLQAGVLVVLVGVATTSVYWKYGDKLLPYYSIPKRFKTTLNLTGIKDGSPTLIGSKYEEERCLDGVDDRMQFMGVHGSRWLKTDKLEDTIRNADNFEGKIRFLIVHPDNQRYRDNKPTDEEYQWCYQSFLELAERYPNTFEVKVYDKLPNFRITTIDRKVAYVSRYFVNGEDPDSYDNQPMVELVRKADWNFFESYLKYFELQWEEATYLQDCKIDSFDGSWGG